MPEPNETLGTCEFIWHDGVHAMTNYCMNWRPSPTPAAQPEQELCECKHFPAKHGKYGCQISGCFCNRPFANRCRCPEAACIAHPTPAAEGDAPVQLQEFAATVEHDLSQIEPREERLDCLEESLGEWVRLVVECDKKNTESILFGMACGEAKKLHSETREKYDSNKRCMYCVIEELERQVLEEK